MAFKEANRTWNDVLHITPNTREVMNNHGEKYFNKGLQLTIETLIESQSIQIESLITL